MVFGKTRGPPRPTQITLRAARALLAAFLLALLIWPGGSSVRAEAAEPVAVHLFWGDGCPHCEDAKDFLGEVAERHPGWELRDYEIWHDETNAALFAEMAAAHGFQPVGIPTVVIGDRHWIGFNDRIAIEIEAALEDCLETGCGAAPPEPPTRTIDLPLLGAVDLSAQSLWVSTALIAFVDGFNPCSLWVLTVLIALALRTGSRRKVLAIGLIFIAVTGGVYALFIAGLFTVLTVVSVVAWVRIVVALIALGFGAVNVKDYLWYREGLSFTIDERSKPGIYRRMRRVLDASGSFWPLAGATFVLAVAVSIVEFACTAGFPVLWANLLAAHGVTGTEFSLLLLLFMLIYQLDELAVFLAAVFTLRASRIEERHGRLLKLVGGVLMIALAGVMIFRPSLMDSLAGSLAVFAIAFGVTGLVLIVHRRILPAFGIRIGTEQLSQTPSHGPPADNGRA